MEGCSSSSFHIPPLPLPHPWEEGRSDSVNSQSFWNMLLSEELTNVSEKKVVLSCRCYNLQNATTPRATHTQGYLKLGNTAPVLRLEATTWGGEGHWNGWRGWRIREEGVRFQGREGLPNTAQAQPGDSVRKTGALSGCWSSCHQLKPRWSWMLAQDLGDDGCVLRVSAQMRTLQLREAK